MKSVPDYETNAQPNKRCDNHTTRKTSDAAPLVAILLVCDLRHQRVHGGKAVHHAVHPSAARFEALSLVHQMGVRLRGLTIH